MLHFATWVTYSRGISPRFTDSKQKVIFCRAFGGFWNITRTTPDTSAKHKFYFFFTIFVIRIDMIFYQGFGSIFIITQGSVYMNKVIFWSDMIIVVDGSSPIDLLPIFLISILFLSMHVHIFMYLFIYIYIYIHHLYLSKAKLH